MPPKKRVKLLRQHWINNRPHKPGRILELNEGTADFLVRAGAGRLIDVPEVALPAPLRGIRRRSPRSPRPPHSPVSPIPPTPPVE